MSSTRPGQLHHWVGKNVPRKEDPVILAGRATYIDDVRVPGMLHAAVLRSPFAHARIARVDLEPALAVPGVVAALGGREAQALVGPAPAFCAEPVQQHAIAVDRVRFCGEAVAAVAATSRHAAEDACQRIDVEYDPLPALVDPFAAALPDATRLHEGLASNVAFERTLRFGDVEADFARAAHVVRGTFRWHRMSAQPLETAGALARFEPADGSMTVWSNTNMYNFVPTVFADMLKVPNHKLRLVPCHVGGSFGSKHLISKCILIAAALAKESGRPVKYLEDRIDNLAANDNLGPDRHYEAELAVSDAGEFLALRLQITDDYGAYFRFAHGQHGNALSQPVGPYRIRSLEYDVTCVLTNKDQQGFFRGAGSDPGNFVIERLADAAAAKLGLDRIEIRRRNFIQPDEFPYRIPTGKIYDSGDYERVLDLALETADWDYWRREQERLRGEGRYLGIGLASCQERSTYAATEWWFLYDKPPLPLTSTPESVRLAIDAAGGFLATVGCPFWGQSSATLVAQVVAEEFGVDPDLVSVEHADSRVGFLSAGPGGSRLTVMLSGATAGASRKLKEKLVRIAAHAMELPAQELEVADGAVRRRGGRAQLSIADLAAKAHLFQLDLPEGEEAGLSATFTYAHPLTTQPNADRSDLGAFYPIVSHACHIPIVEVDPETGHVAVIKYFAVHDSGTVMNPRLLDGQVIGGIAQGIGAALLEEYVYDEAGQLLSSTWGEYLLPSIHEVPEIVVRHCETPSPFTEYGVKGAGEGGRLVAPAALASAIEDALAPFGARIRELPMTPERVLELIRSGASS